MAISVIIPVYNAAAFVEKAVQSALAIKEVKEIILIEDCSPDDALAICEKLVEKYPERIQLYTHPNHENRGAGASRNLGIEKASQPYISFLDADDYYLPERFIEPLKVLKNTPEIDFVVSPSKVEDSEEYKYVDQAINQPNYDLFSGVLTGKYGYFDTNSIIIRKDALMSLKNYFNPNLRLHQDSEFWLRVCYHLKGFAEQKTWPGSIVRRHPFNRIIHKNAESIYLYWSTVENYFQHQNLPKHLKQFIKSRSNYYKALKQESITAKWAMLKIKINDPKILKKIP